MVKFSVIIPTYNQCLYLKKAVKSVLNQTYKNYEIIIIDNFSKDKTEELIKEFKTSKIIYKKFNNNGVIGSSRNYGINLAKGNWIAFLDSDDWWHKKKLEIIFKNIKENTDYVVFCSSELIVNETNNKNKVWVYGPFKKNFYSHLLLKGNCISTSASVVSKKFIKSKNIFFSTKKKIVTVEDYDFFLKIAYKKGKFKFIKNVLGGHLIHSQSMSSNYFIHKKSLTNVIEKHFENIKKNFFLKKILKFRSLFALHILDIKYFLFKKNYLKAIFFIVFLIIFYPDRCLQFLKNRIKMNFLSKNNII